MTRVGIIGLGTHGQRYARHLAAGDVPGAELGPVCRRNQEQGGRLARELAVPFTPDYRQVLSDPAVDAVALVVPCDLHRQLVPEALAAGKAVLVEKPLAPDPESAAEICASASRAKKPTMVAQTLRFNSVVRTMLSRRDTLGRLQFLAISQRFEPSPHAWLDETPAGGILRNTGVHSFDLLRHLSGHEVEEVSCFVSRVVTRKTEDSFSAILRLSGGGMAVVDNHRATASRTGRIELVGEKGQLLGDHLHHHLVEVRGRSCQPVPMPAPVPTIPETLKAFLAVVRGEAPNPIPVEEGVRAVEIVDACRSSAAGGRPRAVTRRVF